jgi:phosphonopyruvate decarboxylase
MLKPQTLYTVFNSLGFGPYISVPCSILKPLLNYIADQPDAKHYAATDEGEALGMASGMYLAGKKSVVLVQNSGLGNMVDPLTSLSLVFNIPVLLIISWRGEPGKPDEPQHQIMGSLMTQFLQTMGIAHELLQDETQAEAQVCRLAGIMEKTGKPAALIVSKGMLNEYKRAQKPADSRISLLRKEAVQIILRHIPDTAPLIASTGKIARELYFLDKKPLQPVFYMLGSMGCANAIGFGVAETVPAKKVVVLDGDGALLMRLGSLATIGHYRPKNLIHIVLDNECHESTGGQETVSATTDLKTIASACGYAVSMFVRTADELTAGLAQALRGEGPVFMHVKVLKGSDPNLGRPRDTPEQQKTAFMTLLRSSPVIFPSPLRREGGGEGEN